MPILENIQTLCIKHNTTVPNLERELSLGNGSIYKWNKSSPKVDTLRKIAEHFNVTIDSLVADTYIVEDENNKEDLKKFIDSKGSRPYIILSAKAQKNGMPLDVLEQLIKMYSK